jgi:Zn-dependent peptidase ImmA (M78 family)
MVSEKARLFRAIKSEASITLEAFFNEHRDKITYPITDSFKTLEALGALIVSFETDDALSGFQSNKNGFPCIFVNSAHGLGRQNFSLWHEFYHFYTGEQSSLSYWKEAQSDPVEQKADYFAGAVLMPEIEVKALLESYQVRNVKYITNKHIIKMQHYFHVSYNAMVTRLIQIFPDTNLYSRYGLGKSREKLKETTEQLGLDMTYETPTNDVYISPTFFEDLEKNIDENRIASEASSEILNLIESKVSEYGE